MDGEKSRNGSVEQSELKMLDQEIEKYLKDEPGHRNIRTVVLTVLGVLFLEAAAYLGWRFTQMPVKASVTAAVPEERTGSVNIDTLDGRHLGYYGNVRIQNDGQDGHQVIIWMDKAWLVGESVK